MAKSLPTIEHHSATPNARAWSSVSERTVVYALVLINLCVTLPLAYHLNIWTDEAYTLHTTTNGPLFAWHRAINFELQPPLYFVLLNLWRELNGSIFFARLFSVICIALAVWVAAALSRRYVPRVHAGWLAGVVALHPFAVWAALEIRVYALVILLSALLLQLFFDGYLAREVRPARARALYLLLSILALYTHYYLGFLLVGCACVLLLRRDWRVLRSYLLGMLAVAICFTPLALTVREQMRVLNASGGRAVAPAEALKILYWRLYEYALPIEWLPSPTLRSWLVRFGFVAALGVLFMSLRRRAAQRFPAAPLALTATVAALFLVPLLSTGEAFTHARHTTALFLPVALSLVALFASFERKKLLAAWALLSCSFYAVSLFSTYAPLAKTGDWARVAAYLRAHEQPGQPVLVFRASAALPLAHYYGGPNPLVPLPRAANLATYDLNSDILGGERDIIEALARVPGEHERLWLVTETPCEYLGIDFNCAALEGFVKENYTVESSQHFLNAKVRRLRQVFANP